MQKKNHIPPETASHWQDEIKKQERTAMFKKITMWGAIIGASILGLAGLVVLADKSGSTTVVPIENANLPKISENDIIEGDPKAQLTITEYADFQCPACASVNLITKQALEEYKGKIKLVYRFFPLRGIHKNAMISGQAGYAAYKLGKFPEMKDLLYDNQPDWENIDNPEKIFEGYASSIGLDLEKFKTIMNSEEAKKAVENGEGEAMSLGLKSTPTFFLGNNQITIPNYDELKKLIDAELLKSKPLQ